MFDTVGVDADHDVGGLVHHVRAVADFDHQRVDVDDRIHRVQRPGLPGSYLVEHGVGDRGDRVVADLHAEGAFRGKSAANYVANVLNMGRATVYKHLKELKA